MRKGDKLICKKEVKNFLGWILFEKNTEYEVLYVDNDDVEVMVCLNHALYGNEYNFHLHGLRNISHIKNDLYV